MMTTSNLRQIKSLVDHWSYSGRKTITKLWPTLRNNWHLGLTAFGGPPVHFKILHQKFVVKLKWIDQQMYQELFSISQALSGPASLKMLYCINLIHDGLPAGILAFFLFSLPGAIGMFALSLAISHIGTTLPRAVYALLSGLNAATVGIIAGAAVDLSGIAITDTLTRILVLLSGAAGLMYQALWYFPVLIFAAGCATIVYDSRWIPRVYRATIKPVLVRARPSHTLESGSQAAQHQSHELSSEHHVEEQRTVPPDYRLNFSWKTGTAIISAFLFTFATVMVLRGTLPRPPVLYKLFANLYLAGTIIFGGGPVVVPLLREYIVAEGWVSPRDFLVGLAIIQAFPGPNFNFAVFLGGLAAVNNGYSLVLGAVIAYVAMFLPGMVLVHGTMGVWKVIRSKPWVKSGVRGINAGAVGLIYTAVYRIWQVGFLDEKFQSGKSLGDDPWWVVVAATAYVGSRYLGVPAPLALLLGGTMGLIRYAVITR